MASVKIVSLPNPVLRQRSRRVAVVDDPIRQLAAAMVAETLAWEKERPHEAGVAMAAVQVGQPIRLIVVRTDPKRSDPDAFASYINPEIVKTSGEPIVDTEGCLSVPEFYGAVPRFPLVKVRARTLDGQEVRLTARDFMARVLQHEIDHTHGRLFIDRVVDNQFFKLAADGELTPLDDKTINQSSILRYRTR
ncbi:peptide deformylase [Candidatus Microgenomates bacterium]|nr:peptide deformylase [Candidatus Microgenomates bacterium]